MASSTTVSRPADSACDSGDTRDISAGEGGTRAAGTIRPIRTVLVANRGEIACRVISTLRRLGIRSVAIYTDVDADAAHVALADTAIRVGPPVTADDPVATPSAKGYLDIDAVVAAARQAGADAVHPGYGFLSENQDFAAALVEAGVIFIGPPASAIATMGDKITARAAVGERDVPVVPGISRPGLTDDELVAAAGDIGFPVLIKPSAGGGGKGMHRVDDPAALPAALVTARREAAGAFGDDTLFLERFVDTPRHIEVQVLADEHGSVIHLGERECSLQRRHQKVIEEAPSALLDDATRARIGAAACDAARSVGYTGAGTVEFIVSAHRPDEFFFMEMNTRLQVEHPVTEMVTGLDLVEQQIRVARGERLGVAQHDVVMSGHAIEARVYAEDPAAGFLPTGGTVIALEEPETGGSSGVRVDSALVRGLEIGSDYDPMLAKVIAHGDDRAQALERLDRALSQTRVLGVVTNIDFCRHVLQRPEVIEARLDTELLDRVAEEYAAPTPPPQAAAVVGLSRVATGRLGVRDSASSGEVAPHRDPDGDPWRQSVGWRIGGRSPVITRLTRDGEVYSVAADIASTARGELTGTVTVTLETDTETGAASAETANPQWSSHIRYRPDGEGRVRLILDGVGEQWSVAAAADGPGGYSGTEDPEIWWVSGPTGTWQFRQARSLADDAAADAVGDIVSPMPGTVVAVGVSDGQHVTAGTAVVVVEAMKMEHTLTAPLDGHAHVGVRVGDKVAAGQSLATIAIREED